MTNVKAPLGDFPTLHPLVVHFPIVFLLLAFLFQLLSFFFYRKELSWVAMLLTALGFFGALLSGEYLDIAHPDVGKLPADAQAVYDMHKQYADYTFWISAVAVMIKIVSHYFLKRKLVGEILFTMIIGTCAYTVTVAGHLGSQLVHINGVGPQGKYLDMDHDKTR